MRIWKLSRLAEAYLLTALFLVSCAGTSASGSAGATPTPDITTSPAASTEPSVGISTPSPASATPTPTSSDDGSGPTFLAATVDGLRLRTAPDVDAPAFVFQCNPVGGCDDRVVINSGWKVLALGGPVAADGYDWYLVMLDPNHPGSAHLG